MKSSLRIALLLLALAAVTASAQGYRILTYNVGLLRVFGSDLVPSVAARTAAAPAEVARFARENEPTVILLEEIWRDDAAAAITTALAPLGYSAVHPRVHSIVGLSSGLLLLVRAPLTVADWSFAPFARTTFTDSFARKGVLQVTLKDSATGAEIVLVGTHMVAVDTVQGVPTEKAQVDAVSSQVAQVRAALAGRSKNGALPAIVLGDFNVGPGYADAVYQAITAGSSLVEAGATRDEPGALITWDPVNPLVRFGGYPEEPAAKIDHVFLQPGQSSAWTVTDARVVLFDVVPGVTASPKKGGEPVPAPLSDHYGFMVDVTLAAK